MAKKELDFGKLKLPTKPTVVKKENPPAASEQVIEKAVETIHTPTPPVAPPVVVVAEPTPVQPAQPVQEELKKISLDLPGSMYTFIKMHTFTRRITMREYMLELITEDMKKKGAL